MSAIFSNVISHSIVLSCKPVIKKDTRSLTFISKKQESPSNELSNSICPFKDAVFLIPLAAFQKLPTTNPNHISPPPPPPLSDYITIGSIVFNRIFPVLRIIVQKKSFRSNPVGNSSHRGESLFVFHIIDFEYLFLGKLMSTKYLPALLWFQ